MIQPTEVEPWDGYRMWLRYQDGNTGELDQSHRQPAPQQFPWPAVR